MKRGLTSTNRLLGVVLAVLAGFCATHAPASAEEYVSSVDEIASALRQDPILVHETLGAGRTASLHDQLTELAAEVPVDVYVALVNTPPSVAEDADDTSGYLIQALHNRLEKPGLYVVATPDGALAVETFGIDADSTVLSLMVSDNVNLVHARIREAHGLDEGGATLALTAEIALRTAADQQPEAGSDSYATMTNDEIDELASLPYAYQSEDDVVEPAESRTGFIWMVGATSGVVLLLLVQQTLRRAWPGWGRRAPAKPKRRTQSAPTDDIETVRGRAGRELTRLATALSRAPAEVPHQEHLQQAMLARTAAEHVHGSEEMADVVGALVLARTGLRDVERASMPESGEPYRCCYFNPLHGKSTTTVGWQFGDAMLRVPACDRCAGAHKRGHAPDSLTVLDGHRERPYYERDDVWARTGFGSLSDEFGGAALEALR